MTLRKVSKDERVVSANDFGFLVEGFIRSYLKNVYWVDKKIREWWSLLEDYYRQHIITDIEVEIALSEPPRPNRESLQHKDIWKKIVADLRGPKHPFTIKYHCDKCNAKNIKLWRGVHGCADEYGHKLLCASCLAPGVEVDNDGRWQEPNLGMFTDQVKGWLPAIPVDDTFWGYSSVPSQDVEWWVALPTYNA